MKVAIIFAALLAVVIATPYFGGYGIGGYGSYRGYGIGGYRGYGGYGMGAYGGYGGFSGYGGFGYMQRYPDGYHGGYYRRYRPNYYNKKY